MNGIDPATVIEQAARYDASTFLLALVLLMIFLGGSGFLTTMFVKVWLPSRRDQQKFLEATIETHDKLAESQREQVQIQKRATRNARRISESLATVAKSGSSAAEASSNNRILLRQSHEMAVACIGHACDWMDGVAERADMPQELRQHTDSIRQLIHDSKDRSKP